MEASNCAFQGVSKTSVGYRLITNMGWQEGEGLGVNKNGITRHLRSKKRIDRQGIGTDRGEIREKAWEKNSLVFDKVLSGLIEIKSSNDCEGDLAKLDKKQKKKSKQSHLKRYSKQKKSKLVKSYSEADLAAILGHSATDPPSPLSDLEKEVQIKPKANHEKEEWWSGLFVRAGTLDQIQHLKKDKSSKKATDMVKKFSEQDQEALYCQVQQISSKSRQGLGKSKELKIGGVRTNQGTKTTFNDSDNDSASQDSTPLDHQTSKQRRKKAKQRVLKSSSTIHCLRSIA